MSANENRKVSPHGGKDMRAKGRCNQGVLRGVEVCRLSYLSSTPQTTVRRITEFRTSARHTFRQLAGRGCERRL